MACRMLPVDEAVVQPGRVFAQRFELGAFALLDLRLDAVDRFLNEELQRRAMDAADVRHDFDVALDGNAANELDESERTAPAQPDLIDMHATAPPRHHRKHDTGLTAGRNDAGHDFGRLNVAALFGDCLDADRAPKAAR